jgi:hypothetical protein
MMNHKLVSIPNMLDDEVTRSVWVPILYITDRVCEDPLMLRTVRCMAYLLLCYPLGSRFLIS